METSASGFAVRASLVVGADFDGVEDMALAMTEVDGILPISCSREDLRR